MTRKRVVAAALCAAIVFGGCGSAGDDVGAGGGASADQGLAEFVGCMRRQGIQLSDPVVTGGDKVEIRPAPGAPIAPQEEFDAATRACEAEGFSRFGDGERRRLDRSKEDQAVAFARCARSHGVDLPDPRFEDGAITNWEPDGLGIDVEAPDVAAVGERCAGESGFNPWEDL
ncbi:MAG TPA: hypothetical protein VM942_01040 [Acidimicrobiales bacterium]|nr:hypothetical protein [Acidimicrobiales bacterium]